MTLPWNWFSPAWIVAAIASALYALVIARRATRLQRLAALAALVVFLIAFVSPLGALADGYIFSAHMAQHLLLLLVVPLLVVRALPESSAERWPLRRLLATPALGWSAALVAMWAWHQPLLCTASFANGAVALLRDASFVAAGIFFWWPIAGPVDRDRLAPPAGVAYLFTACVGCTALGIYLTFTSVQVCPAFVDASSRLPLIATLRDQGFSAQVDQQLGGLLMWVPPCLIYASASLALIARWYRPVTARVSA